ncbi:hypothetical protein OTJ99_001160 [Caldicellulosiruptor naganoensis]|uniref:Uncharacterized protein n=1 Tax=Caldicellulosiruptor naganoensis TaxID=29324 RepID=A0ABY7BIC1_9FIRM|nr:hypothetical protein OTJ99_001160 [Caldicellulosiruptor naganoensis]
MRKLREKLFLRQIENVFKNSHFYKRKYEGVGINLNGIKSLDDIKKLPFTTKEEVREAYPLGLMSTD